MSSIKGSGLVILFSNLFSNLVILVIWVGLNSENLHKIIWTHPITTGKLQGDFDLLITFASNISSTAFSITSLLCMGVL